MARQAAKGRGRQGQEQNGQGPGTELARQNDRVGQVRAMFKKVEDQITKALARQLDPGQFIRICLTTYQRGGDDMFKADPRSFIAACIEAAQLGLKPDGVLQEAYLIPRFNKHLDCVVVNMQLGYRGLMKLARRSQEIADLTAEVVYENDDFHVHLGTDRRIDHTPWWVLKREEAGEVVAAYATAKMRGDAATVSFKALPRKEIDKARSLSQTNQFWGNHFDAMARKTAMRRLCTWLPLTGDMERAVARDSIRSEGGIDEDLRSIIDTMARERPGKSVEDLIPPGEDPTITQIENEPGEAPEDA